MRVSHLSISDNRGGAAKAAYRIHSGLLSLGVQSTMWVGYRERNEPEIRQFTNHTFLQRRLAQLGRRIDAHLLVNAQVSSDEAVSTGFFGYDPMVAIKSDRPDILQVHWIGGGLIRLSRLACCPVPIVWRLADMWPLCGTEHYSGDSARYLEGYSPSNRPAGSRGPDVSRWAWANKRRTYERVKELTIVAPSQWLAECARNSALLRERRIVVIKTGCDLQTFRPRDREACREVLGIPPGKLVVLSGADWFGTRRKGADLLRESLANLSRLLPPSDFELVLFGNPSNALCAKLPFEVRGFGHVESSLLLAILYAAADVFVAPSRQENLANTVLEAMACGTPCVAFNIGGMPDAIDHEINGYLAVPYDTQDMAAGINWVLTAATSTHRHAARRKMEQEFDAESQGRRFLSLYEEVLGKSTDQDPQENRHVKADHPISSTG